MTAGVWDACCGMAEERMITDHMSGAHPILIALGRELKIAREYKDITQQELAKEIHFSDSQISAVETGKRPPSDAFVQRADDVLSTGGLLGRLLETAQATATHEVMPEWFRPWAEVEATATALRSYQPLVWMGCSRPPPTPAPCSRPATPQPTRKP